MWPFYTINHNESRVGEILMCHGLNFVLNHFDTKYNIDGETLSLACYGGCQVGSSSIQTSSVLHALEL